MAGAAASAFAGKSSAASAFSVSGQATAGFVTVIASGSGAFYAEDSTKVLFRGIPTLERSAAFNIAGSSEWWSNRVTSSYSVTGSTTCAFSGGNAQRGAFSVSTKTSAAFTANNTKQASASIFGSSSAQFAGYPLGSASYSIAGSTVPTFYSELPHFYGGGKTTPSFVGGYGQGTPDHIAIRDFDVVAYANQRPQRATVWTQQ
jgi:hypothetical protein